MSVSVHCLSFYFVSGFSVESLRNSVLNEKSLHELLLVRRAWTKETKL